MSKVIAIGRRAEILPFKAAGVELLEVENRQSAGAAFESIMEIAESCVVLVTQEIYDAATAEVEAFRGGGTRAVLVMASAGTPTGKRMRAMRALVARAVGVDLLGRV